MEKNTTTQPTHEEITSPCHHSSILTIPDDFTKFDDVSFRDEVSAFDNGLEEVPDEVSAFCNEVDIPVDEASVKASNETSVEANNDVNAVPVEELLPPSDLLPIYVKSCSRRNLAVLLIRRLVDPDVRRRSNVKGRGKVKLDMLELLIILKPNVLSITLAHQQKKRRHGLSLSSQLMKAVGV